MRHEAWMLGCISSFPAVARRKLGGLVRTVERIPKLMNMASDIPIVTKARVAGGRVLRVRFAGDPRDYKLDLTGLIARSRHLARLMEDDAFAKVEIVEDGLGIAWPLETKWGRLDLSGSTLRKIAEENKVSETRVLEKLILGLSWSLA